MAWKDKEMPIADCRLPNEKTGAWILYSAIGNRQSTIIIIGLCSLLMGCADKSYNQNAYDRQNNALNDPMHYGPKPDEFGKDMPDVTRGGIGDSDREGLHRDLNRVFNP